MEHIQGYDSWKTTPPEQNESPAAHCSLCGAPLYEGDGILDVFGEMWCDDCIENNRRTL